MSYKHNHDKKEALKYAEEIIDNEREGFFLTCCVLNNDEKGEGERIEMIGHCGEKEIVVGLAEVVCKALDTVGELNLFITSLSKALARKNFDLGDKPLKEKSFTVSELLELLTKFAPKKE